MKQLWTWGLRKQMEFEEVERGFENERGEGVVVSIALVEKVKVTALFLLISSQRLGWCFIGFFFPNKELKNSLKIECLSRKL
jgi:hypothetical protein